MTDDYALFARYYDFMEPWIAPARSAVTRAVRAAGCRRVLDVCCGTGTQAAALRREGVQTTGLDLSAAMLAQAGRKADLCGAALVRGDAARLPFPDAVFDGLILSFALHEKPAPVRRAMLAEARRVLIPSGRLFVLDYACPGSLAGRMVLAALSLVERKAGSEHHRAFRDYLNAGGTEAFLASENWIALRRRSFGKGTVVFYETVGHKNVST
jgi:demethylmenaquinone methyltransferase/2-methoxy-6-polyprenyl-1,4-benzoquinol methylase